MGDFVYEDESDLTRTKKVFASIDEACIRFDLSHPTWLDLNVRDFKLRAKTRFTQDSFHEPIDFDYLEVQVIEE